MIMPDRIYRPVAPHGKKPDEEVAVLDNLYNEEVSEHFCTSMGARFHHKGLGDVFLQIGPLDKYLVRADTPEKQDGLAIKAGFMSKSGKENGFTRIN